MIIYFSATGNSKHTAIMLSEALNEETVSVLDVQYQEILVPKGERMILVYPNYCGGVPTVIREFLENGRFRIAGGAELILVVTYGNNSGRSGAIAEKLFKKNTGCTFDAMYSVKMPDNWTPVFDLTDAAAVAEINRRADDKIAEIIQMILRGARGDYIEDKLGKIMEFIHPHMYKSLGKTAHLHVEDSCIGCGACAEKCPVQAIEMRGNKPYWVPENCAMCLGCLHRCPKFAIQYDDKTKNHGQYLHPDAAEF